MAQNQSAASEGKRFRPGQNRIAAPIGVVFVVLALIGLIAVIYLSVQLTLRLMDDSNEKKEFERILLPVLMFDPPPFEKAEDVDQTILLRASVWAAMTSKQADSFRYDDIGRVIVPQSDVDLQCARLFGTDISLQHQSFYSNVEIVYVYDSASKSYFIPTMGESDYYTPSVVRVVKNGDLFTLTVGYIPPLNVFTQLTAEDGWKTNPEKYMLYIMKKVENHYQLLSIRDLTPEMKAEWEPNVIRPADAYNTDSQISVPAVSITP